MDDLGADGLTRVVQLRTRSGGTAWIIGTAHVSRTDAVDRLIRRVKPNTVALELCLSRAAELGIPPDRLLPPPSHSQGGSLVGLFGLTMAIMFSHMSASMSDMYEEAQYGGEQRVAMQRGLECGARIALVDRAMTITLARAEYTMSWRDLYEQLPSAMGCVEMPPKYMAPPWLLARLMYGTVMKRYDVVADTLDALVADAGMFDPTFASSRAGRAMLQWNTVITSIIRTGDLSTYTRADVQHFFQRLVSVITSDPSLLAAMAPAFTTERDVTLAHAIKDCPGERVVAVVGAGHVDGILRAWDAAIEPAKLQELYQPPPLQPLRVVGLPMAVLLASGYGMFRLHRVSRRAAFGVVGVAAATCYGVAHAMHVVTDRVRGALAVPTRRAMNQR